MIKFMCDNMGPGYQHILNFIKNQDIAPKSPVIIDHVGDDNVTPQLPHHFTCPTTENNITDNNNSTCNNTYFNNNCNATTLAASFFNDLTPLFSNSTAFFDHTYFFADNNTIPILHNHLNNFVNNGQTAPIMNSDKSTPPFSPYVMASPSDMNFDSFLESNPFTTQAEEDSPMFVFTEFVSTL